MKRGRGPENDRGDNQSRCQSRRIFLKEALKDDPELNAVSEFVHFGCTSSINNLAHALRSATGTGSHRAL